MDGPLPAPSLIPATLEGQSYPHFPEGDAEAQRGEVTGPR